MFPRGGRRASIRWWRCGTSNPLVAGEAGFGSLNRRHLRNHVVEVGPRTEVGGGLVLVADLLNLLRDHPEVSRRADSQFHFAAADVGELDFNFVADQNR